MTCPCLKLFRRTLEVGPGSAGVVRGRGKLASGKFAAGGDSDLPGRNVARIALKYLHYVTIVPVNRVGAAGAIRSQATTSRLSAGSPGHRGDALARKSYTAPVYCFPLSLSA